jgi:succinate dehydrogenase hydrophobic anchor subunit
VILVTLYALLSAVAFVVHLSHQQWEPMVHVAILSAASYHGGYNLRRVLSERSFNHKLGGAIFGVVLIALALYLSHRSIPLVVTKVSGELWVIIGVAVGALASVNFFKRG